MQRKGSPCSWWWEYKLVQPLLKTVWRSFKKLKIELPRDPAGSHLSMFLKEMRTLTQKYTCPSRSLHHRSRQQRCGHRAVRQWANGCRRCDVFRHTQRDVIQPPRKRAIPPFAAMGMGLEDIVLSDESQTDKDKYCTICRIQKRQIGLVDIGNRLVIARGRGWEVGEMGKGTNFQL